MIYSCPKLAKKFVKSIPVGYKRVHIAGDMYQKFSIKNIERENRGESSIVLVNFLHSKIPFRLIVTTRHG